MATPATPLELPGLAPMADVIINEEAGEETILLVEIPWLAKLASPCKRDGSKDPRQHNCITYRREVDRTLSW
jgi:hypothetical protein